MISLDLMKLSEVRKAGDQSLYQFLLLYYFISLQKKPSLVKVMT